MNKKKIITDVLRELGLHKVAQELYFDAPHLKEITERMIEFIGTDFSGPNAPLYKECVGKAFAAYEASSQDDAEMHYLLGLTELAYVLFEKRIAVETSTGLVAWVPMVEPITSFMEKNGLPKPIIINEAAPGCVTKEQASLLLAIRVMPADYAASLFDHYVNELVRTDNG